MARKIYNHDKGEQNEMIMKYLEEVKKKILLNVSHYAKSDSSMHSETSEDMHEAQPYEEDALKKAKDFLAKLKNKIITMECKDLLAYYPTLNYISVEKVKDFNVKATGVDKKLPHLNKKWIQTRRALGIKTVIDQDQDWVLITKEKSKSKELKDRILDIELHKLGATEETWKLACKMLDHNYPRAE
ncbi:hypothetical protein H5410_000881 [Solanum commersonii]|uniref:Uncharacterized protein n=1 Tax=Solanum commersonii TaxID=4109 RepID=A0A9J6AXH8_SOLCO|nr:hypothetical protein H5410_000881 [Solanum commersonii]